VSAELEGHVAVRRAKTNEYLPLVPNASDATDILGLAGEGQIQGKPLPVSDVMEILLYAQEPGAFAITPLDAQQKSLAPGGHAEWHWTVTPKQAGCRDLELSLRSLSPTQLA
jgi:hypothetical protein